MIEILMRGACVEAHVKLHPDCQALADEWSGVTNPVLRRKLQNRLNQRAARRRKAAIRGSEASIEKGDIVDKPLEQYESGNGAFRSIREANGCHPPLTVLIHDRLCQIQALHRRILSERDNVAFHPLPSDHLLSLVYYNVYRALVANVALLGLNLDLMSTDDYPSPFTPCSSTATSTLKSLPPALQPTKLQQTVAHHPQWDIVPVPRCRDNLLRRGQDVDLNDVEMCLDLIGSEARRQKAEKNSEPAGCIVWGDPWDLRSWEVTEGFVCKYPWLFVGTSDLEASTNFHRAKRDEKPLRFVELGVPED